MKGRILKEVASVLAGLLLLTSCTSTPQENISSSLGESREEQHSYQASFLTLFDTVTYLSGYASSKEEFEEWANKVYQELEEYHFLFTIYEDAPEGNNLKTINDQAGIAPVKVEERLLDLLLFSQEMYEETEGIVNIAMGSVLSIWHDYREKGLERPDEAEVPPMELLEEANQHTHIEDMILNVEESTVYLADPAMSLDVGAVAKGYATERVAQSMEAQGLDNMLLSVGGNVRAIGSKPDHIPWYAGVDNPYEAQGDYITIVELVEGDSLVISGNYQRFYMVDGERYHHIIHPETLMPMNTFSAVAVLCKDSGKADGYSTALYNMSLEEGQAWVEAQDGVEVMWMMPDRQLHYSSGFSSHLKKNS